MNLFRMASRGVDLGALPEDDAPRALIDFGPSAGPVVRGSVPAEMNDLFEAAASEYGVDPTILKGIAYAESRFRPDIISGQVTSPAGAVGLMQFMPATAKEMGINPLDPVESVFGAAAYLRQSLDKFGGDTERAIASYNWGRNRSAFDREDWFKSLPAETRNYVGTVLEFADGLQAPAVESAPQHGTQIPLADGVQPSAAGAGRGTFDDPRRLDNPENQPQKPFLSQVADSAAGLVKTAAASNPVLGRFLKIAGGPQDKPSGSVLIDQPVVVGGANPNDMAENERLSRRDYAEQVEQRQRLANSQQMREPVAPTGAQAYAEANPIKAALKGDAARTLAGALNAPSVLAGLGTESVNRAATDAGGAPVFDRVPNMPLVDDLRKVTQDYASQLARRSPGQAWDNGEFGRWMMTQMAGNSMSAAQSLSALMLPGAQATLLGSMGAVAAGSAYGDGDTAGAAALKGLVEVGSEKLPLHAAEKVKDLVLAIPASARNQVLTEAGKRLLAAGTAISANSLVGAIEESAAEIGGNAIDKYVSGKNKSLFEDVDRAALVGAAFGGGMSAPAVAATMGTPQGIAARELAGALQADLPAAGGTVAEMLRTEQNSTAQIAPEATSLAAADAEVARLQSVPQVQDQPTTPQAPVVVQPQQVAEVPVQPPVAPAAPEQSQAEQAVENIGALMGAPQAPAAQPSVSTVEQAEQQLAAREAPVEMQMRPTGTLLVKGDVPALRERLAAAGVDNTIAVQGGLVVSRSQAAQAQQALSTTAPAPQPPAATQQEAANVPQTQAPATQPEAKTTTATTSDIARTDAAIPAAGVPQQGAGMAQPKKDGVTGQKIDSEWTAFAPESGTKAVPRADMPQIKAEHRGAMVNFLKARGVDATQDEMPASSLKPTQAEFSPVKVEQAKAYTGGDRSILVSSDGYVLDGHHQWMARRETGESVKVIRLDAPIAELLPIVKEFPSSTQAQGAATTKPATGPDMAKASPAQLLALSQNPTSPLQAAAARELRRRETDAVYQERDAQRDADGDKIVAEARDQQVAQATAQSVAQELNAPTAMYEAMRRAREKAGAGTQYSREMSRELAEAIMAIRPPSQARMATKESVRAALEQLVPAGGRLPNGLGRIIVVNAAEISPQWVPLIGQVDFASEDAGRAQGFYDQRTKTVFLIADHIKAGDEIAVAAHELMHKHGQAVLGAEGWNRLHSTIELWANAPEGSTERQVYDEAAARVEASRPSDVSIPEYTTQELFPYAVQVALEMGVQPSALKPISTVAGWLAHVRGALRRVWNKIANPKGDFNSLDLVNLAFGIAQRENPAHHGELDAATEARAADAANALLEISEAGDLFALPKSSEITVEGIAAEHDPDIKVRVTDLNSETMHTLTMPDGTQATITTREPTRDAVYGMDEANGQWITERPGENAPPTASKGDVWVDVSRLRPGKWGGAVYNIAATYAHNTGRIFIGDPSGLSDVAMRRRAEQMLGSALKFGTTDHLAPHPRQVAGDAGLGVPALRWVYGDTPGNIQRLVDVNQAALENAFPDAKKLSYDLGSGNFTDASTGETISREALARAVDPGRAEGTARAAGAGWRTLARSAVFRAILGRGAGESQGQGRSRRAESGPGRGQVLDGTVRQPDQLGAPGDAGIQPDRSALADLAGQRDSLSAEEPGQRIFYSRSPGNSYQDKPALQWRDDTGRLQFAPGQWLFEKLGDAASPMLGLLGLKAASPELRRQLRVMKLQVQRAQELSAKVATEAAKLSAADRAMVSDLVEKDMQAGTIPPEHAVKLAAIISTTMERQSKELVELGMLSKEAAERWEGTYLPRFYESKMTKKVGDAWADAMRRLVGKPRLMKGIGGKHLKGRGIFETINPASLENYQALGWEVRDPDYVPGTSTEVQVWRDFNREERASMGEIRDAGFRFVMGYMQTQRDIALGRMFENLANDERFSSRLPTKEMAVRVPDSKVEGTGATVYGKLAGRYVSKETLSHLSSFDEVHNDALQMYRQAMSLWKEGKTVLNPVAHMNNVVSNLTMAHLAGISYHRGDKYISALGDFIKGSPMIEDAKNAGLFLGNFSQSELMESMPDELKKLVNLQEGLGAKSAKTALAVMTMMLRKPMSKAYEFEDSFFKYMLYKDARKRGLEQQDAIDYAQRYIFTYDDLPKGARRIRDFGIPFFAYTYKAVPALLHTAMAHPVRMATPAALLWATTALTYAAMADGDDDTPWDELVKKYLTDAEFRKKAGEAREFDQKHMPTWMRGSTAFFTPKTMRVGYDKVMDLPVFLDISRFIPGGDLFDVTPNAGGLPLPQPITPNHPILTMAMGMLGNKDMFTGKEIVDKNDTNGEAAEKRAAWIYRQVAPAVAVGQYHWNRGMEMVAQASGGEITWLPDIISERFTGIGTDGLSVLPEYGIPQTFGIKIRPMDQDKAEAIERAIDRKLIQSIDADISQLARQNRKGILSDKSFEKQRDYQREKRDRLKNGLTVDGSEKE